MIPWAAVAAITSTSLSLFGKKKKAKVIDDPAVVALNKAKAGQATRLGASSMAANEERSARLKELAREGIGEEYASAERGLARRFAGVPGGSKSSLFRNLIVQLSAGKASEVIKAYGSIDETMASQAFAAEQQNKSLSAGLLGSMVSPTIAYQPEEVRDFSAVTTSLSELASIYGQTGSPQGTTGGIAGANTAQASGFGRLYQGTAPRVSSNLSFINRWGQPATWR